MGWTWRKIAHLALGLAVLVALGLLLPGTLWVERSPEAAAAGRSGLLEGLEIPLPPLDDELTALPADDWSSSDGPALDEGTILSAVGLDEPAPEAMDADSAPLDCLIEPWETVELGSPVRGLIRAIHVDRAQRVEAGQLLVELEDSVERAAVQVASARAEMSGDVLAREADLALEQRRRERGRELFDRDALSLELWEQLDTEAEVARRELQKSQEAMRLAALQLNEARAVLGRREIQSPISGVVVERLMAPGERVDEDPILRLAQTHPLRVEVILPASMFGEIRPGMRATILPELRDDQVHVAEVALVDPLIDAASGTFGARLVLPNPDQRIPGGLHCQVRFLDE